MVTLADFNFRDEELMEIARDYVKPTGYPKTLKTYRLVYEIYNMSIEESYFFVLGHLRQDQGFPETIKLTDVFSASEQSAIWGNAAQRLSIQQDKASQFMATIGSMVKDLFKLVRDMRILDERLQTYEDSYRGMESAEITLKGWWIDLVEGGTKSPASVYGLATQVGFTVLPDLFFSIHPKKTTDVDRIVDALKGKFNRKLREVLKRKLFSFLGWKENTYKELKTRRRFVLRYLRQHYNVINMYLGWVKPYLKNAARMKMRDEHAESTDLITAFEGSMLDIEFLAMRQYKNTDYRSVICATFNYRTRPTMAYNQEYQRGPLHVGKCDMTFRVYSWTKSQVDDFVRMKRQEDFELLGYADESVKSAMEALGDDLNNYLKEAGEDIKEEKKDIAPPKPRQENIISPFVSVFKGFYELFDALTGVSGMVQKKKRTTDHEDKEARKAAEKAALGAAWQVYKNYKKAHRMVTW